MQLSFKITNKLDFSIPALFKQGSILSKINAPSDIKNLSSENLVTLCAELRDYIISVVSEKGGHLGASLGVVDE